MNRRLFIKSCLAAGAVTALPGFAFAAPGIRTQTRLYMDTTVSISAVHGSTSLADEAIAKAFDRIAALEKVFNRHDSSSALGLLNSRGKLAGAPQELCALLGESITLHKDTSGTFDVSVAPLVDAIKGKSHFDRHDFAEAKALADISSVRLSGRTITLERNGMGLTFDGIAKGTIVDQAANAMRLVGMENFLINAGGDIYAAGQKEPGKNWSIAIESPEKDGNYPAVISLSNRAVATSGNYERPGHLVVPQSGICTAHYKSVTVNAPTAQEADFMATTLSALPLREAKALVAARPGCAALFIDKNGKLHSSNWA